MSDFTFTTNLLKIYTNKNSSIFSQAGNLAINDINDKIGFIYDDFDYKDDFKKMWGKYNLNKIFVNAPRRLTVKMDDKIHFHNIMNTSDYTPQSYTSVDEITDKNSLYFVKKSNSTGSKGVQIYNYNDLLKADVNNCIIQKNILNPDLHNDKRYKIRQLVLLYNKNVYIFKNSFFTSSNINHQNDISDDNLREMHVIYQNNDTVFELSNKLDNFDTIFENIILSIKDFSKYYHNDINNIEGDIYCILGFDFIVDSNYNVQIIEINHRSNYSHPTNVTLDCDVNFFKSILILLANGEANDLLLI